MSLRSVFAAGSFSLDFETGRKVKGSLEPRVEFDRLAHASYSDSVILFSDVARDPVNERVGAGFCVPSTGYRFGVRLSDFTSALSAELYAVFCALKRVYRWHVPSAVIFTDSLFSLYHLRDRLSSFRVSPFAYKILHLASLIRVREGSVGFAWVSSHAGIMVNEMADSVARLALHLPFMVQCGVSREDLFLMLERDHQSWRRRLWPYSVSSSGHNRYFDRVSFKSPRPWFSELSFPRSYICLITRLRSSHVCTGSHFGRMGCDAAVARP